MASAQLAGKHARFSITAKALKTRVAKPIDDELAKASAWRTSPR
jgi:FKBP-type peptidyl-prolyl cis-trans isomerase (trigger factor)